MTFVRVGKQILAHGSHYADASDETAAEFILNALTKAQRYNDLHHAAHAYFHATCERTARIAAKPLREALAQVSQ